ncbi:NmrA/HSCARG family protein [Ktedonosporobacter rubrisoli]|uniref:NmrA/HSCARG family protein n=1 Tax=Ktedonosporobacter rubrisoli TaxID=2509675 RepID=A0A4P6JZH7_KTERU|nr:NmrA/HSCARG family protein [Ktedonosporobacter rubrisoli]QBD80830.1 NmrA/HSCARG family protein [Ktedonosporobacter rubrisoli]
MNKTDKIILVTGATGQQGGATARHLLAEGWHVRALSRDLSKPQVAALRRAGAEVVQGDHADRASLEAAMQGVYGVYSVQPHVADETLQGKNIAEAAKAAGVQHFVYMSGESAEGLYRIGANISKWEIEQHVKALGLPATILRASGFMESLLGPFLDLANRIFSMPLRPDVAMNLIAVDDIGAFAALVFAKPGEFLGKTMTVAADSLTLAQIAAALSRASGRQISYVQIPLETVRQQSEEFARVSEFFNNGGYEADISLARRLYPALMDFETWLGRQSQVLLRAQ